MKERRLLLEQEETIVERDCICLEDMVFYAYHGVFPEENRLGQRFEVTAALYLEPTNAGKTDQLTDTVHYADMYERVASIMNGPPVKLIETLAERIAASVLRCDRRVRTVTVRVRKPQPPVAASWGGVSLAITRHRQENGQ